MNDLHKHISTLAFYLPQFHEVAENSKWWGKGYTDWTAVKKAVPLYEGHKQPKIPLNGYYYDLMNKDTLLWQAGLMRTYGIDGLCFYHYYFKDGRRILEKPAENLLRWKDIAMPFCFAWANGSWSRSWSKVAGTGWSWNELEDSTAKPDEEGDGLLLDQKYGREPAWKNHFEYLLPFFNDSRYIKLDGRPVFIIHQADAVLPLRAMCGYWRKLAKEAGLPGLYLIGMNIFSGNLNGLDAEIYNTPHRAWNLTNAPCENGVRQPSFDAAWENMLQYRPIDGHKTYFEGMGDYDDTPRRGSISGIAFRGYSTEKLEKYMEELYLKSFAHNNEFLFFNAWNEWGEGMYLEPDEDEGYARLKAVKNAREKAIKRFCEEGKAACVGYLSLPCSQQIPEKRPKELIHALARERCLDELLDCMEKGLDISALLKKSCIKIVAVYGMGVVGRHIAAGLEKCGCIIDYIIDKQVPTGCRYKRYSPDDILPDVDAVIITPISEFDSIYDILSKKVNAWIISALELTREAEKNYCQKNKTEKNS